MHLLKLLKSQKSLGVRCVLPNRTSAKRALSTQVHIEYREPLQKGKWDLWSGVCVERRPIISQKLTDTEATYQRHLLALEHELSQKSDHELAVEEAIKKAKTNLITESDENISDNAQEREDKWSEFSEKVILRPRTTEIDNINEKKSLDRKLDKHLTLLVKQKLGQDSVWILPQLKRNEGESMRQTADRVISSLLGKQISVAILGNAPWGYYKYKYPLSEGLESVGAKVFFYKCYLVSGVIDTNPEEIEDYCWLTREEMYSKLKRNYCKAVSKILINEE